MRFVGVDQLSRASNSKPRATFTKLSRVDPKPRLSHFVFVFEICVLGRLWVKNVFSKKTIKTCVLWELTNCLARRICVLALYHCWGGRPRWRARAFCFLFYFSKNVLHAGMSWEALPLVSRTWLVEPGWCAHVVCSLRARGSIGCALDVHMFGVE